MKMTNDVRLLRLNGHEEEIGVPFFAVSKSCTLKMSKAIAKKSKTLFHATSVTDIPIIYDIWIKQERLYFIL